MKEISLNKKLSAINRAVSIGFVVDNDESLDVNYDNARETYYDYKYEKKSLPLIKAFSFSKHNGGTQHMSWVFEDEDGFVDGELYYNERLGRYEEVIQLSDGRVFKLVNK